MSTFFLSRSSARKRLKHPVAKRALRFENLENRVMMTVEPTLLASPGFVGPMPEPVPVQVAAPVPAATEQVRANSATPPSAAAANAATPAFQAELRATPQSSKALVDGGMTHGTIRAPGQVDTYTFDTTKTGERVEIASTTTTGDVRLVVRVFDPRGREVPLDSDGRYRLPNPGQYVVQVQDLYLRGTGSYKIGFERISRPSADAKPVQWGKVQSGTIDESLKKDQYKFQTGRPNVFVEIASTTTTGDARLVIRVFDPLGDEVPLDSGGRYRLPNPGQYVVQVQDLYLRGTGSYKIGFERINPPSPDVRQLFLGQVRSGRITQLLQKDQYSVETTRNKQTIELTQTKGSGAAVYFVYNVRGNVVTSGFVSNKVSLNLGVGKYVIQVQDRWLKDTFSYTIRWR
ncbi:MAG: hypothetical protein FJ276_12735 [Planctomycetes bacterium]|nr:hypothetical protein [Planctomycetota bacterium]